ncbi:MAG: magnesium transporter, partial [Pseudomonadota bacterium]
MSAPAPATPTVDPSDGETAVETMVRVQKNVEDALDGGKAGDVEALIEPLHSADIADLLEQLSHENRRSLVAILRPQLPQEPEFLSYLDGDVREDVLEILNPDEVAGALSELDSDDALELIEDLSP